MKREQIIEILKRVFACSMALDSDFEDWTNEIETLTQQDEPSVSVEEYFEKRYGKPEDKFYMSEKSFDYYDMVDFAEQYAQHVQKDEWVSVEERFPEDDLPVIVWYDEADSFGIASYKDETWSESYRGWVFEDMVTHWKELYNNPPKTEK